MGYRSEVKSIIYGNKAQMDAFMQKYKPEYDWLDATCELSTFEREGQDRFFIYLNMDYCKWYDEYEEVQRWHDFLAKASDHGLCTEFVRIGESSEGDIQTEYSGQNNLNFLTPRVTIDVGFNY